MLQQHLPGDDVVSGEGQQLQHAIFHLGDADRMSVDADQALDRIDRQAAAAQRFGQLAAPGLEAGEQSRCRLFILLWATG
jgi:hypothetical protein